jgi:hypothetical protein
VVPVLSGNKCEKYPSKICWFVGKEKLNIFSGGEKRGSEHIDPKTFSSIFDIDPCCNERYLFPLFLQIHHSCLAINAF